MSKSLRDKARLARELPLREWLWMIEAWWKLLGYFLALRWFSYERLGVSIHPPAEASAQQSLSVARAQFRLVGWASRLHLLPMTCLPRALTLRSMLGRRGIRADLRIGARKSVGGIHAHAWVEVQGVAVGETDDLMENFQVLDSAGA